MDVRNYKPLQGGVSPAFVVPAHNPPLQLLRRHALVAKFDWVSLTVSAIHSGAARERLKRLLQRAIQTFNERFFVRMATDLLAETLLGSIRDMLTSVTPLSLRHF